MTKDEVLDFVDVDLRYISGPEYRGPASPAGPDGTRRDIWGVLRKPIRGESCENLYETVVESPLEFVRKSEDIAAFDNWPSADWFDFDMVEAQCEAYRNKKRIVTRF